MQCPVGFAVAGAPEHAAEPGAGFHQFSQVDAGVKAHAMQGVHQIFAGQVAAGAFGIRATAGSGYRRVNGAHARFQTGEDIGQRLSVGVVEMHGHRG